MLPHNVRFVFLSATIPNSKEFAEVGGWSLGCSPGRNAAADRVV